MKQKLRVFLTLLLCAVASVGWGEEVKYSMTPNQDNTGSTATSYITSLTEFTYEDVSWKMNQWNPSTLQVRTNQSSAASEFRFYNTSAFSGRITKVVITFSALTVSDASKLMFLGGTSEVTSTTGGTAGTWDSTEKTLTWTPGASDNFTYFAFYQNGKAASGSNYLSDKDAIVVSYEGSGSNMEPSNLTLGSSSLSFDLYGNSDAKTITYTTSSTGAVTVSESEFVETSVNAENKTITVTPKKKTSSAQTITVSQAADDTYAAGSATFTVTVDDSTPETGSWVETSLSDLTSDDVFVIVGNDYALPHNNGTDAAPGLVPVTISESKITSPITDIIKWNVSGNATDGYTFYPYENKERWLYCNTTASSSSNNNIRVGTGARKVFELTSNNYLKTKDNYTSRYLSIYETQDWRGYTSTGNAPVIKFYKLTDASATSISVSNVNLAFNATSGSFNYTITNPIDGTLLTASTEASWISDVTVGTDNPVVTFTVEANMGEERSAVITLTYGELTKDVTVTQAAAPVSYTTIPALFEAATSETKDVNVTFNNWVVSGVSTNGKNVFVTDNNGNGFVIFDSDGGLGNTYAVGSILSGTVSCSLKKNSGYAQLTGVSGLTITTGGSVTEASIEMANLAGVNTGALVSYDNLTCHVSTSGNYTNYDLTDGTTTIRVYNSLFAFGALEAGKTYNITGIYQQYNNTKEILPRNADDIVVVEEASITVNPNPVEVAAAGGEGTIDVTYNYITDVNAEVQFFAADGTTSESYDWIEAELDDNNNIYYVVSENTSSEARTAYLKVYALDDNAKNIYSELITITQAAAATPGTGDSYELFSGELVEGDYIIYYEGKAMNTTITNNRLQYAEVTPANNVISTDNTAIVWHIAKSGDYWTIYNADANAYAAATSSNNQAQMLVDGTDDKAQWTVSDEYDFTNKANSRLLRNNGTYGFACYGATTGGALSLYKKVEAVAEDVTIDEADYVDEAYVPTDKYANVTFKRTLVEGWNGLVLPFDMTVDDAKTKFNATAVKDFIGVTYDPEKGTTLNFSDADEIKAGKPFMIKATADGTQYTFEGVQLKSSTLQTISWQDGDAKYTMTGTYQKVDLTNENFVLIQGNKYYQHNTNKESSAKAFRAYFVNESTGEALSKGINVNFDGEATGIELVENGQFANNQNGVYNLQGQKVNNAQKGVYIVNGKKIVVK